MVAPFLLLKFIVLAPVGAIPIVSSSLIYVFFCAFHRFALLLTVNYINITPTGPIVAGWRSSFFFTKHSPTHVHCVSYGYPAPSGCAPFLTNTSHVQKQHQGTHVQTSTSKSRSNSSSSSNSSNHRNSSSNIRKWMLAVARLAQQRVFIYDKIKYIPQ